MSIGVLETVLEAVKSTARDSYPNELAGVLGADAEGRIVRALELARGTASRVRVSAAAFEAAKKTLADDALSFAGTYHSHGRERAYPSAVDKIRLQHGELLMICGVRTGELRVFRRAERGRAPEELAVRVERS